MTAMADIHVCLLSGQLLPNLIPVFMDQPKRVYLVTTPEMEQTRHDRRMQRMLRSRNVEVRKRTRAPSAGFTAIRDYAGKLADELASGEMGNRIVLNATGGTKLLSMGFVEVFRERLEGYALRVIYTDTEHQMVETLVPRNQDPVVMQGVLKADTYLAAQGMALESAASDDTAWRAAVHDRASLTDFLATNCSALGPFFGTLNGLVHGHREASGALSTDGNALIRPDRQFQRRPQGLWREALTRIADAGLLWWGGAEEVRFESLQAARYLGGHWLEEYVWLGAEAAGLDDFRGSAVCRWALQSGPETPTNEFDLLAVHGNRLLVIECKTGRQDTGEQAVASRLESLGRNAGGLFGTSLLVSARELPTTMKNRCRSLGIRVLEKESIIDFRSSLNQWRDTGHMSI